MAKVALLPLKTHPRFPEENRRRLENKIREIERERADLILLPECTLTGYVYELEDLKKFGEPLTGSTFSFMSRMAKRLAAYICFGIVERSGEKFYDTGILIDRNGEIVLVQRKLSEKPPYSKGQEIVVKETELGKISCLICGDLFYPEAVGQIPDDLDLLLVPMARAFAGKSPDVEQWESKEKNIYIEAVKGMRALLVNALEYDVDEPSFGGALVVERGKLLAESPHGSDRILILEK